MGSVNKLDAKGRSGWHLICLKFYMISYGGLMIYDDPKVAVFT